MEATLAAGTRVTRRPTTPQYVFTGPVYVTGPVAPTSPLRRPGPNEIWVGPVVPTTGQRSPGTTCRTRPNRDQRAYEHRDPYATEPSDREVWAATFGGGGGVGPTSVAWAPPQRRMPMPSHAINDVANAFVASGPTVMPSWTRPEYTQRAVERLNAVTQGRSGIDLKNIGVPDSIRVVGERVLSATSTVLLVGSFAFGMIAAGETAGYWQVQPVNGEPIPEASVEGDLAISLPLSVSSVSAGDEIADASGFWEVADSKLMPGGFAFSGTDGTVQNVDAGESVFRYERAVPNAGGLASLATVPGAVLLAGLAAGAWWASTRIAG